MFRYVIASLVPAVFLTVAAAACGDDDDAGTADAALADAGDRSDGAVVVDGSTSDAAAGAYQPTPVDIEGVAPTFSVVQIAPHSFAVRSYANAVIHDLGGQLMLVDTLNPAFLGGSDLADLQTTITQLEALGLISSTDVAYIANTHWHPDHVGNNDAFGADGAMIVAGRGGELRVATPQSIAYFEADLPAWAETTWPDQEIADHATLGGKQVVLDYAPFSHTTTDLVVTLPEERLVITGDLIIGAWIAFTDHANGGTTRGLIRSVQAILDRTPDDYLVVPGHNAVMTKAAAQAWIDAISDGLAFVAARVAKGESVPEIQAAIVLPEDRGGPSAAFAALDSEALPVTAFVDFAYRDLTERDEAALLAARAIATLETVSGAAMVEAIVATIDDGDQGIDAAGTEYDTLRFQVDELAAIDARNPDAEILTADANAAFALYTQAVADARADERRDFTPEEHAALLAALDAL